MGRLNHFTSFRQPIPCAICGKSHLNHDGTDLCPKCLIEAQTENEHLDGHHDSEPCPTCPMCQAQKE